MNFSIGLEAFMLLSAAMFTLGLYGVISKKSLVGILMSLEIMGMALIVNIVALNRYVTPTTMDGWYFAAFEMALGAAEIAIGLALFVALYRNRKTSEVDDFDEMRG